MCKFIRNLFQRIKDMASIPSLLKQVLQNQADAAAREAVILTTIQNIPGADTQEIKDALAKIDQNVSDIEAQVTDAETTPPTP